MIPKIIHNIWLQGYNNIPNEIKINYNKIKKLNPDWEFIIWDNHMIKTLLKKYPTIYKIYKNIQNLYGISSNIITQNNIAKYVIMKEYGGLYYDINLECFTSYDKLFFYNQKNQKNQKKDINSSIYISSSNYTFFELIYPFYIPKYYSHFFAMEKEHPIWEKVFQTIENTIYKKICIHYQPL